MGLNHKTAPLELRERLSFNPDDLREPLEALLYLPQVSEALILSTCNRVEVLAVVAEAKEGIEAIKDLLCKRHDTSHRGLERYIYAYESAEAITHLFRVASSLDSMVVGEPQILGQLKDAYRQSAHANATGLILNRLLHRAFSTAKRVRTETHIVDGAISVSSVAVDLAKKIFEDLRDKVVLVIGAGKMSELTARHLMGNNVRSIIVTNRTLDRARELAERFKGVAIPFDSLPLGLKEADIVISSTGSPSCIISKDMVSEALRARRHKPIFLIDIAVPRDIDPGVNDLEDAYLYNIDDLEKIARANMGEREREIPRAEAIIIEETANLLSWMKRLEAVPTILRLKAWAEEIRGKEVERFIPKMGPLTQEQREAINALTNAIVNKILHHPITSIKSFTETPEGSRLIEAARKLFHLDEIDKQSRR